MEHRLAAEAALETAEKQNKIAMAKAAAAVEAAGLEVKVSHDDEGRATYRVGDVTIVADAPKSDFLASPSTGWAAVAYRAAGGGNAERLAQPAVAARRLAIGSVTDSADDSARLYLVDKYVTEDTDTTVGIYTIADNARVQTAFASTITDDVPYGGFRFNNKVHPIKRATGVFYRATGPDGAPRAKPDSEGRAANLNAYTIAAGAQPENTGVEDGIYYYDDADGDRSWLKRVGRTEEGIKYDPISVLENARFPAARSYEHLNYGVWSGLKEDGDTLAGLGTGFVATLPDGSVTPADDMPTTGTATYKGDWAGIVRAAAADGDGTLGTWTSDMTTTADFGDNTLTTTLTGLATLKGDIDGNGFSGTDVSGVGTTGGLTGGGGYTGSFSGNFFGPEHEEVGGVFDITSEDRKAGEARGAFGGRQEGSE